MFAQGDEASAIFYIEEGIAKKTYTSGDGRQRILVLLKAREFFGTGCMSGRATRQTTATALTPCLVRRIEKAVMTEALCQNPRLANFFISYLIDRKTQYEDSLVDHLFDSSEIRLARALLRLSSLGTGNDEQVTLPKVSQETLAEIVGTTRSRINLFMNKLRQQGLVEYDNRIRVSAARLKQIVDQERSIP